jgi:hypothetical protein
MAADKDSVFSSLALVFFVLIAVVGTNAFSNFALDLTFPKFSYPNPDYNPKATPVYAEICDSSYGQGETCGETLLNASDYEETVHYREFFLNSVAVFLFGYNEWDQDDMLNPFLIYWAITGGLTWLCWKRIMKALTPKPDDIC